MQLLVIPFILSSLLATGLGLPAGEEKGVDNQNSEGSSLTDNGPGIVYPDDCTCVPYYLCNDNMTNNEDRKDIIDIAGSGSGKCSHFLERCCAKEYTIPDNKHILARPVRNETSSCGNRFRVEVDIHLAIFEDEGLSGYGEFPWMVAVIQNDSSVSQRGRSGIIYHCGGSLIHPKVVLTTAHCVRGKESLLIRAGEWDTQTDKEQYPTQDRRVLEVIIHEEYENQTLNNDIALLILESPVNMTLENVGLICLPDPNEVMDGRNCVTNGWGKALYGKEGEYSVILRRVEVPIVARNQCVKSLRKTRLGQGFSLHESFICAGGQPEKDTCKADEGSPLVCPTSNNPHVYVQAGIVAWSIGCATESPGVYVNVPYFVNWITNTTRARNLVSEQY